MKEVRLITGFLGSGKTTFLLNALKQDQKKVGVLMNEFGVISIDSITIQNESIDLKELTNGSIFCSCLKDKFIEGLIELLKKDLDIIYIESTGLADPSDMKKIIEIIHRLEPALSFKFEGTICLVDGLYFIRAVDKMLSIRRQIKHSHHIIINKRDLISQEIYDEVLQRINKINPQAKITTTSYGKLDINEMQFNYYDISEEISSNTPATRTKAIIIEVNADNKDLTRKILEVFLQEVGGYFYRIKGYLRMDNQVLKIDQVGMALDIEIVEDSQLYTNSHKMNQIVFLASQNLTSIRQITIAAKKHLKKGYKISM